MPQLRMYKTLPVRQLHSGLQRHLPAVRMYEAMPVR